MITKEIIKDFKNKNILVVGDLMIDEYKWGKVRKISPEAPVPVINIEHNEFRLGGSANVINNIVNLGGKIIATGVVGDDVEGVWLCDNLKKLNIDIDGIMIDDSRPTTKKTRVISNNQQIVRIDREKDHNISKEIENRLLKFILKKNIDAIIISDYDKGVITYDLAQAIITMANSNNILVLVDPKGKDFIKYTNADVITPNENEIKEAYNGHDLFSIGYQVMNDLRLLKGLIITLGKDGMWIFTENNQTIIPTEAKKVCDVSGAGDTVIAALALCLSSGIDLFESSKFANIVAGISVGKLGTSTVSIEEISTYMDNLNNKKTSSNIINSNKIKTLDEIKDIIYNYKELNKKVVFTNGCFDILHVGHIKVLEEAKSYGDVLIVGLNSDISIKNIKGNNRPYNGQKDRAKILSSLEFIDYIVIFDDDTPLELISNIKPDILVKGEDYKDKYIVGSDIVIDNKGSVKLIKLVPNCSTSNIIETYKKDNLWR